VTGLAPLLKWPGGKARLAERIAARFPAGPCPGKLLEAFTGSGALFLHLADRVSAAVLADANAGLVNFHQVVRDAPGDLLAELEAFPHGEDWRASYYQVRQAYNDGPRVGPRQAARLLFLNRTAFNGLYRENARGGMNAPAGDYLAPSYPTVGHVLAVSAVLELAEIRVADFRETLALAGAGDWSYVDPPYDPWTASANFTGYAAGGFGLEDQEALAVACLEASTRGASVVASNHGTPRMVTLWAELGYGAELFPIKRSIGCTAASRAAVATELLAWSPPG
jgi:DNA adenine methylase